MDLELRFFAGFRQAVGQKTVERSFDDDATVGDVLRALEEEYEGLAGDLLEDGDVRPQLSILKNGNDVVHMEGTATELADGDRLSVFPPVAGGTDRREKSYRGISARLALRYLENLGGERVDDARVAGDAWSADVSAEKVSVGAAGSLELTEVTVVFEGDADRLDALIEDFSRKALRAGG